MPDYPHPSRVTVTGSDNVTGLLPKCPICPLAEGHTVDHLVTDEATKIRASAGAAARMLSAGEPPLKVLDGVYQAAYQLATEACERKYGVGAFGLAEDGRVEELRETFQLIADTECTR